MATTYMVTPEQFQRIESAWEICSFGNSRRAAGKWAKTFRECVAEVLGFTPADEFKLAVSA